MAIFLVPSIRWAGHLSFKLDGRKYSEVGPWVNIRWVSAIASTHPTRHIHYNPAKHGYVKRVIEWPYSSFHRFVGRGIYPSNWTGDNVQKLDLE
jgi:hypothetical protein